MAFGGSIKDGERTRIAMQRGTSRSVRISCFETNDEQLQQQIRCRAHDGQPGAPAGSDLHGARERGESKGR
jgi:hypothetical protein